MQADVERLTRAHGPAAVATAMADLSAADPRFRVCHEIGHFIAHAGYQMVSAEELMRSSSQACSLGFMDGAVEAAAASGANVAEAGDRAMAMCRAIDPAREDLLDTCFHGLGHTFYDQSGSLPLRSYQWCREAVPDGATVHMLSAPRMRAQCVGGAGMLAAADGRWEGRPLNLCVSALESELWQCLDNVVTYDVRTEGPLATLAWCEDLPRPELVICADSVGYEIGVHDIMQNGPGLPDEVLARCRELGVVEHCSTGYRRWMLGGQEIPVLAPHPVEGRG